MRDHFEDSANEQIHAGRGYQKYVKDLHPRHEVEHRYNDRVCNCDIVTWIREWYSWALSKPRDAEYRSPEDVGVYEPVTEGQGTIRCPRMEKGSRVEECCQQSVWFLGFPMMSDYGLGRTAVKNVNLPLGRWHFLAPVYLCHPSRELLPSKNLNQLIDLAKSDVNTVYDIEIKLDGVNLAGSRIRIEKPFNVEFQESDRNFFGVRSRELSRGTKGQPNSMNIVSDGYWVWIKELPPGDHILITRSYSPVYIIDRQYNLYVRGPCGNCP